MGQGLSLSVRRVIPKQSAAEYARATKKGNGQIFDDLVGVTGWSRANARRALSTALKRRTPGPEREAEAPAADLRIRHTDGADQGIAAGRNALGQVPRGDHWPTNSVTVNFTRREVKLSIGGSVHDPTDPVGRLLFNVLAMVAEFEADLIRARTREGMQVAKAAGRLRGKQPKLSKAQEKHLLSVHKGSP
jgi:Resolvase, N terminal domain